MGLSDSLPPGEEEEEEGASRGGGGGGGGGYVNEGYIKTSPSSSSCESESAASNNHPEMIDLAEFCQENIQRLAAGTDGDRQESTRMSHHQVGRM